ncbi:MAG TPA: transcription-repair coupling factor, partial [Anaeromyxobacteraceae bacterium]|nr:transcription-repair coupling factor [Anaeromyxobacteraceae bacterium]
MDLPHLPQTPSDARRRLRAAVTASRVADVTGVVAAARGLVVQDLLAPGPGRARAVLCVAADEEEADRLAKDVAFFVGADAVTRIPADAVLPYDDLSPDRGVEMERLAALARLHVSPGAAKAIVVSARGLARRAVPGAVFDGGSDLLGKGLTIEREALARRLVDLGYARVPLVEDPGTFAVRGGIVDVWSPAEPQPGRLEFFGDEVESCRRFDPQSQRSEAEDAELLVCPAREALFGEAARAAAKAAILSLAELVNRPTSRVRELLDAIDAGSPFFGLEALLPAFHAGGLVPLFDHLPPETAVYVDDAAAVDDALETLHAELAREHAAALQREELALPPEAHYLSPDDARARLAALPAVRRHGVWLGKGEPVRFSLGDAAALRGEIEASHGEEGALTPLTRRLEDWRKRGLTAVVACGTPSTADRLRRLLADRRQAARSHPGPLGDPRALYDAGIHVHLVPGEISGGFVDGEAGLALLSDEEVFGRRVRKRTRKTKEDNAFAAAFRELEEGDLVVHVEHGIAKYLGLTKMQIRGVEGDFLVLAYDGADRLYLPVAKLRQVQKFTGANPETIRLDRLGGQSFALRKARVKEQLLKMAAELLDIYAARAAHPGHAFAEPDELYREFEAEFPWDETPDQAKAIDDVLGDMRKATGTARPPMDRLVCGDVGYGKTEVAMRAAMLAVLSKKQVAVLVPTTVLAAQHERTFRDRFKGYPVRIEAISRMKTAEEVRTILKDVAAGRVDVVIGTHRLLGSDVTFKELGLVVIDEEQRFGVAHKERLKKLRKLVDVLTLTATPIPRTLHMAMSGVRDLSIIATPPEDRRAIRTFVTKFDPGQVREAIETELKRGGQVFFVHNRVRSIGAMQKFLSDLMPGVRFGVAHGQMGEGKLEEVMTRFVRRELDVLIASAIIESGIDIPSANTIIVNRADHFGLSQLYQIRGRVGRSRERAYAYLLVPARRPVTKDARKRLEVLQRFSELGAGFRIASHDLELRGAGNLLGKDQSGQIEAVGFDLYTQLLEEAVRELQGQAPREEIDPDVTLPLPAFIPDPYMPDVHQRLYFYKRFAQAGTDEELEAIRGEIIDRCGDPPEEVDHLCELMAVKVRLRALGIRSLEAGPGRLVFTLGPDAALDPFRLAKHVQGSAGRLRLTPDMKLVAQLAAPKPAPKPAAPARPMGKGARPAPRAAPRPPPPPPPVAAVPSAALEAAAGRELLE